MISKFRITKHLGLFLLVLGVFTLVQCRQSSRNEEVPNPAPKDNATAVSVFHDVFRTVHAVAWENSLLNGPQDATISNVEDDCIDSVLYAYNTVTFPNTVVVDYGTTANMCDGAYTTSGKLKMVFSGQYNQKSSKVTVSFSDYVVDGLEVSGSLVITNNGQNADSNFVFGFNVTDGLIENDSINIIWNCSRKYEWITGETTDLITDDQFEVTGTANGRTTKGNEFEVEISSPLLLMFSCKWITQGVVQIDLGTSLTERTVDYGAGNCDNDAEITYKNVTRNLEMR